MPASSSGAALPALVLTAGLGTRLRPLTYTRAKAAVPVNGEPLARRVIRWLERQGFRDLVLNLHHHPQSIAAVVGDGGDLGVRVRYSWEQPVLGSAGGPRHALPLLVDGGASSFLVVNGDTLTTLDLQRVIADHDKSGALVTMALIRNPRPDKYGGVLVGADGAVVGFTRPAAGADTYHFIGVQVADAAAFASLPDGVPEESVGSLYPRLMHERPGSVRAFICDAPFQDIGTPADYLATSLALAEREGDRLIPSGAAVHPSARLLRTAVWDDVTIGADVSLDACIVCDRARVPAGASFTRSVLAAAEGRTAQEHEWIEGELLIRNL